MSITLTMRCLPWQTEHWHKLVAAQHAQQLPHALLISGPSGVGKQHFAKTLAQALLCQAPDADFFACGQCRDCRLLAAGSHPDWLDCQPSESSAVIKIDQIRKLIEFVTRTSQTGRFRVVLVTPAERLNLPAANALLKTLEEPPLGVLIILLSSQLNPLPATLRSRCHKLAFGIPDTQLARTWLAEHEADTPDLDSALQLAGGAPLLAQELLNTQQLVNRRALFDIYRALIEQRLSETAAAEQWLRYDVALSLGWLLSWHLDIVRLSLGYTQHGLDNPDLIQELCCLADVVALAECFRRYDAIVQIRQALSGQRNAQMLLEAFFGACANTDSIC